MKPEAIQNERDRIGSTKRGRKRSLPAHLQSVSSCAEGISDSDEGPSPARGTERRCEDEATTAASVRLVDMIVGIENRLQGNQNINTILRGEEQESISLRQRNITTMISWANLLHPLPELPFADKVLLLKHCSSAFALLHTVQRSIHSPYIVLPNDTYLSLTSLHSSDLISAISRILDELISPLRHINVENFELATLKAIILMQPDVTAVSAPSREKLREARDGILRALFTYLTQFYSPCDASVRVSNLLMVIPALFAVAQSLLNNVQLGPLFGLNDQLPTVNCPDLKDANENNLLYKDNLLFSKAGLLAGLVASQNLANYTSVQSDPAVPLPNAPQVNLPLLGTNSSFSVPVKMFIN
ncbi:hypothetical protein AB6A40_009592 [Gnathostoma spinigerum]|uniref:NR LBD domain-containing protein n=1 Tax=Gnathostoma spinigerum TaxID=75299 RepID=A0ABD6ESF2_9BILA